jgi:acyl carrier protein phosphodiesterase
MNYLAHAYLSFNNPEVLVGNMISDYVKGSARYDFPPGIAAGIELHRRIDEFTDTHEATAAAKEFFRPRYRLYSAPIVDIIYDHFLANDPDTFSEQSLFAFTQTVYAILDRNADLLPPKFSALLPYMKQHNWLYHYKEVEGIARSLAGLSQRASAMGDTQEAIDVLNEKRSEIQQCYDVFAPAVKGFAKLQLERLLM